MVTLALVGVGKWGRNYLTAAQLIKGCQIKYICVRSSKTAIPEDYIKVVGHRQLGQFRDIDGVIIATPAKTHFQIAKDLLSKGFNLLIEKPLTMNYKHAKRLAELQELKHAQVMVGHLYNYHPNFMKAKSFVRKAEIIERVDFEGMNQNEMPRGLSCLWEWGPHGVALICDMLSNSPVTVKILKKSTQKIRLRLMLENNMQANLTLGWSYAEKKRLLTVWSSKGIRKFDLTQKTRPPLLERELSEFVRAIDKKDRPKTSIEQGVLTVKVLSDAIKY